jgi:hypothetical protein
MHGGDGDREWETGGEGEGMEGAVSVGVWGTSFSSGSSSSEDMTIGRHRVAARFCRGTGSSGSESEGISMTVDLARCVFRGF